MNISRFLVSASRRRTTHLLPNLHQRFGPSKGIRSFSYSRSTRGDQQNPDLHPVISPKTQASRSWAVYAAPAIILGFAGLAAVVHYNDERRAVPLGTQARALSLLKLESILMATEWRYLSLGKGQKPDGFTVQGPVIGGPFTLMSTENQLVTERDFRGNWILLYFGYTFSPDVGPEQVSVMAKAIDRLEKEKMKVLPVFVTIDPQRDTPSHLRAYLKEFDPRIVGLTGPVSSVRQMAQEYRVYFRKVQEDGDDYFVETSHNMYLINPSMEIVKCFGVEYNADALVEAIGKEMTRDSR